MSTDSEFTPYQTKRNAAYQAVRSLTLLSPFVKVLLDRLSQTNLLALLLFMLLLYSYAVDGASKYPFWKE